MTKEQAKEAMRSGKFVTHRYFTKEKNMCSNRSGTKYHFEDGVTVPAQDFWELRQGESWEDGWELVDMSIY